MEVDINGIGYKISGIAWRIKNEILAGLFLKEDNGI